VLYTGKLLPSLKVFQSNDEGDKPPFKFVVGRRMVIPGMEDGMHGLKKGAVATIYIPAFLAYDQQPGPGQTPNENLAFDIKITDITEAPAENMGPVRPGAAVKPNNQPAKTPAHK
jgi:peptidylprolyl isomerase